MILNRASNHKHSHINKKTRSPTTTVTALLTATSTVTSTTEHNTDHTNPVSVLASNDSASTTTSTTSTYHMDKYQAYSKPKPIQVKQPTFNSYYPCTDGIFAYNPAMNIHYHAVRHSYLLLNQNQVYVPILLSTKRRKEVFPRIHAFQYQDIFNNIIAQSDGLLKDSIGILPYNKLSITILVHSI